MRMLSWYGRRALVGVMLVAALLAVSGCDRFLGAHQRGEQLLQRGDYEGARQAYREAIAAGEDLPVAYANLCFADEALNEHEVAVQDCTKSLELAPEARDTAAYPRWEVLNNRGVAYLGLRDHDAARSDFDAAIAIRPEYADAYANRGRVLIEAEDYEAAIEDLSRAIELNSELAEAYGNRALAYESLADDESALVDYSRAIDLSHDPQAYFNRAMLRYTLGYFDDAYDDFKAVTERVADPDSYLAFMAQQQVQFLEKRPKGFDPRSGATATP